MIKLLSKILVLSMVVLMLISLTACQAITIEENNMENKKIDKLFNKTINSDEIHEGLLLIENMTGDFSICKEYNRTVDTPMLMASITKLFTTTCVLAMIQDEKLSLDDNLSEYLNTEVIEKLHIYKGNDYSSEITIEHLLFQTSGLPDFYLDGKDAMFSKIKTDDFAFSFDEELTLTKAMTPKFAPDTKNKAYYADINFDLLGKIIETVMACTLQEAYETYIFNPLGLENTYLVSSVNDFVPHTYFKDKKIERPQFIGSCFASGGGVTTARELMTFLKAFYGGELFDKSVLSELGRSNPLQMDFYPIRYAGGQMSMNASMPFGEKVKLIGHSGSTGSFAFYAPEKGLFFVGDLAQIASPATAVRFIMQAALAF